ncbi:uncharacterized protein TNCV_2709101 [Trichonephila clavipes]|nr:uncharacterized protein TNCV_2709101 [Trichonephila clavipes]
MCRNRWEQLSDNSSKKQSPIGVGKGKKHLWIYKGSERVRKGGRLGVLEGAVWKPLAGIKDCVLEGAGPHNHLVFREYDFAAAETTDNDVVGDATENNSANPHTLVVESQHMNPPKEPELMANADYEAPKKPVSVFFFISNH